MGSPAEGIFFPRLFLVVPNRRSRTKKNAAEKRIFAAAQRVLARGEKAEDPPESRPTPPGLPKQYRGRAG